MSRRSSLSSALFVLVALGAIHCGDSSTPSDDGAPSGGAGNASSSGGSAGSSGGSSGVVGIDGGSSDSSIDSAAPPAPCAPSWAPTPGCGAAPTQGPDPDFGPNVIVFDPATPMATIQGRIDDVYGKMDADQFDALGYAFLFRPGHYDLDVKVGFYTHVIGLGESPDDVVVSGAVRAKADWLGNDNATCNFWRTVENLAVAPAQDIDDGVDVWATSQATALRRVHVQGSIALSDNGGWSSGGFIGDSKIDATIDSGTQQQYLTRNVDLHQWQGSNWNMVFVGDGQAPSGTWPNPPYTVVASTPVMREKPFLYLDPNGRYAVMVPRVRTNTLGSSWGADPAGNPTPPGSPLSIDSFYVAKAGVDSAATINAALAVGEHLLLTPGQYALDAPIHVTRPGTVVLGLALPVLTATNGNAAITIDDVDGVTIGGVIVEAGATRSDTLVEVGPSGAAASHAPNPTALFDVSCRIGGRTAGTASTCLTVNSSDVLVENAWLWRADHGAGAAWDQNASDSGIVVNGARVTAYGLFSEHHQKFQTLWNGEGGAVYMYQSEMPYDAPDQAAWSEAPGVNGYASYKVADGVATHTAYGLGIYSFFDNPVHAANAIETPSGAGIVMHHMMTFSSGTGGIDAIIDGTGGPAKAYSSD